MRLWDHYLCGILCVGVAMPVTCSRLVLKKTGRSVAWLKALATTDHWKTPTEYAVEADKRCLARP